MSIVSFKLTMPLVPTDKRGFSIISTLVAAGIGAILLSATTLSIINQQKQITRLQYQISLNDLEIQIRRNLSNSAFCVANLSASGPIDLSALNNIATGTMVPGSRKTLNQIFSTNAGSPPLLTAQQPIPNMGRLRVDRIDLMNWTLLNPASNSYSATLSVSFEDWT